MWSTNYLLLIAFVSIPVVYSIICGQRLSGNVYGVMSPIINCTDACGFCRSITRSGGSKDFEVSGCGCGENSIARKLKMDGFKDCNGESESVSAGPTQIYTETDKCCTKEFC
ncbi:unnamed protein product, partial [Mesorhabditis belari]|uniref:Uncharacterized protein n=1 Tax=Mesorhabditis belari TaxID=2138241 RepID=A0AAF3EE56_9BILA